MQRLALMKGLRSSILFALALATLACTDQAPEQASLAHEARKANAETVYDFDKPDAVFTLDPELDEISGLTLMGDSLLGAVQDEKGRLYLIRTSDGTVVRSVRFGKKGDFEGIQRVGDSVYALRSDGRLFHLPAPGPQDRSVESDELETALTERHNTEGLAYDPVHESLLIACKDYPGKGYRNQRAIYAFDLGSARLDPDPAFLIHLDTLEAFLERPRGEATLRTIMRRAFNAADFRPSALAIHPQTGRLWVLSSTLRVAVELESGGNIAQVHLLTDERMPQPEGLAIDADGTVYIASERGRKGRHAHLFVYRAAVKHPPGPDVAPTQPPVP
jgi:uncharacterized protein YjiK